jgi:hypothetical protein
MAGGRTHQRRRGTGARTEIADRQMPQIWSPLCPIRGEYHAAPKQVDVETVPAGMNVNRLFISGEQIEQTPPESMSLQELGDCAIPAAESAAAATMRENHKTGRALGHAQIGANLASSDRNGEGFASSHAARALLLQCGRVRLRQICFVVSPGLQRLQRVRLVDVQYHVELLWQSGLEVVADALGIGPIDHANRAFTRGS